MMDIKKSSGEGTQALLANVKTKKHLNQSWNRKSFLMIRLKLEWHQI
ncbi:hypothetical protein [Paenibacillus woosongensis]|nr:hypothetical protein [Paenibacillus woosongensis]